MDQSKDDLVTLEYSIHQYSSFSSNYLPDNILRDDPADQASRWTSANNLPPQYLILKLNKMSIVRQITFGKFEKMHACNIKNFRVYGSVDDNCYVLLLDGCLENDNQKQTFELKHQLKSKYFPCQYIKIEPIDTWNANFNFTIWSVNLKGIQDVTVVQEAIRWMPKYREQEAIRLCLKHFRQKNYIEAFETLRKKTNISLEDELLTQLYDILVVRGEFDQSELLIADCVRNGLFDDYIRRQSCQPLWHELMMSSVEPKPAQRGGHQMCIDSHNEIIYLFGGFNGKNDLSDFWSFDLKTQKWKCLFADCSETGGPDARSCHKLCLDPKRKKIFTLGKYLNLTTRSTQKVKSDFYVYDCETSTWQMITDDTCSLGGPKPIFDHQMCIDVEQNTIYVFGGRIFNNDLQRNLLDQPLCGLYSYHVPTSTWTLLQEDNDQDGRFINKSRIGHALLFDDYSRQLFIFAGQRNKEHLSDFFAYHVDTHEVNVICDGIQSKVPWSGVTQRATIDPLNREIHVLTGLTKEKERREDCGSIALWLYNIRHNDWKCCFKSEAIPKDNLWNHLPEPRRAHQLAFDYVNKVHYLFGGNPGWSELDKRRLGDLWSLRLKRMSRTELQRICAKLIRQRHFEELIKSNSIDAIQFLQNKLCESFDHSNEDEAKEFQRLASLVFQCEPIDESSESNVDYGHRIRVYEQLVYYFPDELTEPKINLIDLIPL